MLEFVEKELKLRLSNPEDAERITADPLLSELSASGALYSQDYRSTYFDTPDFRLTQAGYAYRIRREGERLVAAVKKGLSSPGVVHQRRELSAEVDSIVPSLKPFFESPFGAQLRELVLGRPLIAIFTASFCRGSMDLILEKETRVEFSLDRGKISAGEKTLPILEIELELKKGELSQMLKLGTALARKYSLAVETDSKFEKGLELTGFTGSS